jgi:hypothetical protein
MAREDGSRATRTGGPYEQGAAALAEIAADRRAACRSLPRLRFEIRSRRRIAAPGTFLWRRPPPARD